MAYTRVNWQNTPSKATPIIAENLNIMDEGISDLHNTLDIQYGAWTPTFTTPSNETISHTDNWLDAYYYKIGRMVYVVMNWGGKVYTDSTDNILIKTSGLPNIVYESQLVIGEIYDCYTIESQNGDRDFTCRISDEGIKFSYNTGVNTTFKWKTSVDPEWAARIEVTGVYIST